MFSKKRYKFNKDSLKFEEIHISLGKRLKKHLLMFLLISFATLLLFYITSLYIGNPVSIHEYELSKTQKNFSQQLINLNYRVDSINKMLINKLYKKDIHYRNILELDPIPLSVREAGIGGANPKKNLNNPLIIMNLASKLARIERQLKIQDESYKSLINSAHTLNKKLSSLPSILPVSKKDMTYISSYFGKRIDPFFKRISIHRGLDYVAPKGTKVYATGDGVVTLSKYSRKGYGNEIVIDHSFGFTTRYAHLSKILVKEEDRVQRGQVIGLVGTTGRSTGPHLHYEVRQNRTPVNPIYYYSDDLTIEEFEQLTKTVNP